VLVSVVFLYPLLLGIRYWKETFVAGMPEMVEVMMSQDKRGGMNSVLIGHTSTKAVTSFSHTPSFDLMDYASLPTPVQADAICEQLTR
jgi:hypothetical protein